MPQGFPSTSTSEKPTKRRRRRSKPGSFSWGRLLLGLVALAFFTLASVIAATYFIFEGIQVPDGNDAESGPLPLPGPDERINVLVLGADSIPDVASRSDTMILVSVDPLTREVGAVSIPRDTRVTIAGRNGPEKINHAYAYGGAPLAVATVREFLNVPVHYYVEIDYEGFVNVIDILGGVEIDVEMPMDYEDPTQDLYIHLSAGNQVLNGEDALKYVRYRNDSDINRIARQQKFISALTDKLFRLGTLLKAKVLADQFVQYVKTDAGSGVMAKLVLLAPQIDRDRIQMGMIPGDSVLMEDLSYWLPRAEETQALVDRLIRGIVHDSNQDVTVEVLNGCGRPNAATEAGEALRDLGYNVVECGNAPDMGTSPNSFTRVIDHTEDEIMGKLMVRAMSHILGEGATVQLYQDGEPGMSDSSESPMITVIIGNH